MQAIDTRIQMKRDTSENWNKVVSPPLEGELLIYLDGSGNNIKIGDGKKLPKDLPFASINELFFNTEIQKILAKFDDYLLIEEYVNGSTGGVIDLTNYLKKSEASSLYLSCFSPQSLGCAC